MKLLFGDRDGGAGGVPVDVQHALVEGDGEVFDGGGGGGDFHVNAGEVVGWAGIVGAPLTGFLADDENPLILVGDGEQGVATGGNGGAAYDDLSSVYKSGGFIGSGAPDLAEGNEFAEDFASFGAWAGVVNGDGLTAAEIHGGLSGGTGALGLVLLGPKDDNGHDESQTENGNGCHCFTHADSPIEGRALGNNPGAS